MGSNDQASVRAGELSGKARRFRSARRRFCAHPWPYAVGAARHGSAPRRFSACSVIPGG